MLKKPTRPKILRDIDAAMVPALTGVKGVVSFTHAGFDWRAGWVVMRVTVGARQQAALRRWLERMMAR